MKHLRPSRSLIAAALLGLTVLVGCGGGGAGTPAPPPLGGTRVAGTVANATDGSPAVGIVVQVFDSVGNWRGQGETNAMGQYNFAVPLSAVRISLAPTSLGSTYYSNFYFGGEVYSASIANCQAPLPTLVENQTTVLGTMGIETRFGPPPPPPTGCR